MKRNNDSLPSEDEPSSKKIAMESPKAVSSSHLDWSDEEVHDVLLRRNIPEETAKILRGIANT